jgi:ADP-heptose:LPS heptosyltransferase
MESATYEDQFGRVARRLLRLYRPVRRRAKEFLGVRPEILVEIRWHVGDEIMAIPIYEALRATCSTCRITILCNHPELLEGNPFVDAVNKVRRDPDLYILLRSGPRHVYRLEHYARCAGIATPDIRPRLYYSDWRAPLVADIREPFVAVCANASWATKRWPIERWRVLCRALSDLGYPVVELGTGDEPIGVGRVLVKKTSLREAACVLHAARLLICCDSGLMHLALAAGGRVLALFGPTDPDILVRNEPRLMSVVVDRACHGCWNREVDFDQPGTCPLKRHTCLEAVTAEQVIEQVRRILDPTRRGP